MNTAHTENLDIQTALAHNDPILAFQGKIHVLKCQQQIYVCICLHSILTYQTYLVPSYVRRTC
jgi:hypothetical protein